MAGAMDEELAVTGVGDDAPTDPIDLLGGRAHRGGRHRGRLRLEQHVVELDELVRGFSGEDAAGEIGAVADAVVTVHRAPEIAEHDLVLADDAVAGVMMRTRGIGAGGDDGEVHPAVALGQDLTAELGRDLGLGSADQGYLAGLEADSDAIDGGGRRSQPLDLVGALHRSQRRHDVGGVAERDVGAPFDQPDEEPGPRRVADRDRSGRPDEAGDEIERLLGLGPRQQRELRSLGDPGSLQLRDHEAGLSVTGQDEHREAFQRHGVVAGEVRQIGAGGEKHDVGPGCRHLVAGTLQAVGEHGAPSARDRISDGVSLS